MSMKEKTKKAFQDFVDSHKEPITDVAEASKLLYDLINEYKDWSNVDFHDGINYDNLQECKYENDYLYFSCLCRYPSINGQIHGQIHGQIQRYKIVFDRMESKQIGNVPCIIIYNKIGKYLCNEHDGKHEHEYVIANGDYVVIHDKNCSRVLYEDVKKLRISK